MVNMKDVAKDANVSVATVSNYINGKKVRPEVEEQVRQSIEKLHYVRNAAARALKTSESKYVVFVLPTVWSPFFSELTFWVQQYLNDMGYKLILSVSENNYFKEKSYVKMAEEQRVAGIISISYSDLNSHVPANIPLVSIEKDDTGMFPLVTSNNYDGGKIAVSEFHKRGVTSAIYAGTLHEEFSPMIARKSGFIDQCNNLGIHYSILDVPSSKNTEDFHKFLNQLSESVKDKEADFGKLGIFAYSDEVAIHIKEKLDEEKIKVPEQVQIIGFDGSKIYPNTRLTVSSIRQDVQQIANKATEILDKQIKGNSEREASRIMVPVNFQQGLTTTSI